MNARDLVAPNQRIAQEPALTLRVSFWGRCWSAAMKDQTLGVIALGVVAVGAAWTVHTLASADYYCPGPSAASVVALLAPCQAFDTALGHTVSGDEAVRMALPWGSNPDRADPPPTQFAEK